MRKPLTAALVVAVLALAGATGVLYYRWQQSKVAFADVKAAEQTASARYAETIEAIAEIQDSLNAISLGSSVSMESGGLATERSLDGPNAHQALDRISLLRASIQRNKERIQTLEADLAKSGTQVKGLSRLIANLKSDVTAKEQVIAQLSGRVDSLQTQVAGLETTVQQTQEVVAQREQTIEDKRRELATVYYAVGTRKLLADNGVIAARGGVLGLGKTLAPTGLVKDGLFRPIDTDQETVVQIDAPRVQVVSAQAPTSYELRVVNGKTELHILNPQEFRKVKQLIIVTA